MSSAEVGSVAHHRVPWWALKTPAKPAKTIPRVVKCSSPRMVPTKRGSVMMRVRFMIQAHTISIVSQRISVGMSGVFIAFHRILACVKTIISEK